MMSQISPQSLDSGSRLPRHRHATAYVAIVLEGSYCETGDLGRLSASAGDVLVHGRWEAHQDIVGSNGARLLNVPTDLDRLPGLYRSEKLDLVLKALRDGETGDLAEWFEPSLVPVQQCGGDWPEQLVASINQDPSLSLGAWAAERNLRPPEVSRGFAARYGLSPKKFRAEAKARTALLSILKSHATLASIAQASGFSDQSHMTTAICAMTGRPPSFWRFPRSPGQDVRMPRKTCDGA
ncbi:AraC family transcriptional regulator [Sphingomonas sp. ASV193]|uniref:AraC family transcriptional regulator n=1 Tax=Sphingomonas sp. ASV193 TaxID=3144405 RepID=UPI0032E857B6